MGAIPNDSGGDGWRPPHLRIRADGALDLMSADDPAWSTQPSPSPAGRPARPRPPDPADASTPRGQKNPRAAAPPPALVGTLAAIKEGRASFALRFAANADCAGAAELLAARGAGTRATAAARRRRRTRILRQDDVPIKGGKKATIRVKLGAAGRKALKRHRKVAATLKLTPVGGTARSRKITLKR